MESGSERSSPGEGGDHGVKVDQKRRSDSCTVGDNHEDLPKQEAPIEEPPMTNTERSMPEAVPISASSTKKEEVDELENAKAEMGEVIQENQRLKMSLNRILNDYRTLQMQFHNTVKKETKSSSHKINDQQEMLLEESELVSLSLGRLPSNDKAKASKPLKEEECTEGLALGLDCKFETSNKSESTTELKFPNNPISPTNSSEVPKEEGGETWPPSKILKTARDDAGEDEVSQHINPTKKARVCVRARCDTPTMNDGCQWRKYGQKISKGNPCPRAYYRCTVAPSCPVRKQVQRCAQDMSILITTYEGNHNHPLPLSATAMASTTSAAASMLLSGSSSSADTAAPPSTNNNLHHHHGINFYLSHPPPSSLSSCSPASHPTITLDLTTTNPNSSSPFARFTSNYNNNPARYSPSPSTSLSFSSSSEHNIAITPSWNANNNSFLSYNNRNLLSNISLGGIRSSSSSSSQPVENIYHSYMQRNNNNNNNHPLDNIAAATKVITSDPSFQSALAAALTSIIATQGTNQQGGGGGGVGGDNLGQKLKWGEMLFSGSNNNNPSALSASTSSSTAYNNGCAASSLSFLPPPPPPPSLPFSGTKSASGSPSDHNKDKTN